jgi:hypothetical protein
LDGEERPFQVLVGGGAPEWLPEPGAPACRHGMTPAGFFFWPVAARICLGARCLRCDATPEGDVVVAAEKRRGWPELAQVVGGGRAVKAVGGTAK